MARQTSAGPGAIAQRRIGMPTTCRANRWEEGTRIADSTSSHRRAIQRLALPGGASRLIRVTGTRARRAAATTGAATNPPKATTRSTLSR